MGMPGTLRRWTREEVLVLPEDGNRYELIDGELLVTPSPRLSHQGVVALLLIKLHEYSTRENVGRVLPSPSDIELEPEFITQPDVFVLPTREWRRVFAEGNPARELLLTIEALSR